MKWGRNAERLKPVKFWTWKRVGNALMIAGSYLIAGIFLLIILIGYIMSDSYFTISALLSMFGQ